LIKALLPVSLVILIFFVVLFLLNTTPPDPPKRVVAVLNYSPAGESALLGFKAGLAKRGYYSGVNLEIIYSGVITDRALLEEEAHRLASLKPDVFYTISTSATLAAKKATKEYDIPIVFGPVSSPVRTGIIPSLRGHGLNITGVTFGPQEGRRLEMLTKIVPSVKNILVVYNPKDISPLTGLKLLDPIANKLGLNLLHLKVPDNLQIETLLNNYDKDFDAILITTDSSMVSKSNLIADFAIQKGVPYTCPQQEGVKGGALFSYGFSIVSTGEQASRLVHMIFKGTEAKEVPIELSEFKLTVNTDTANELHMKIPLYISNSATLIGKSDVY